MGRWLRTAVVVGAWLVGATAWPCAAAPVAPAAQKAEAGGRVVVLDGLSVWRAYHVLKPPVIEAEGGLKTLTTDCWWLDKETAAAPADWQKAEFAGDVTWLRGGARASARTPYLADLCLRAKFEVTDPAQVTDLKLSVAYYGGAIVYVNGQEVARGNVAQGLAGLAESYPLTAFVNDKGELVPSGWVGRNSPQTVAARERRLADIAIPAKLLRRGVNVVAIEVLRAPYDKAVEEKKGQGVEARELKDRGSPYSLTWNTCEIQQIRLTAGEAAGLVANASRPKGLQVWNSDLLASDYATDWGDPCEPLRPMALRGARNGWISGKVVVGSPTALEGLKASCGDLKQGEATIPASALRVRYATHFGSTDTYEDARARNAAVLDCLLESPPASFPTVGKDGAVAPIWLTVKVPREAKAGTYTGQMTIEAKGEKAISVPVRLEVADFAVPDPWDYQTWMDLLESPDTLAAEYGVALWSDRHWEMIETALRYIGQIGGKVIYVPLICTTNAGNAESMVRWVKKEDGSYDYDFKIMDKYLDLATKYIARPKFVSFTAWEIYLDTPKQEVKIGENDTDSMRREKGWKALRWDLRGKGPGVTALDPATGQTGTVNLPRFEEPAAKAAWKPLFDELHRRMAKRGLEQAMVLGIASDVWPNKEEVAVLEEVSGNLPWISETHGGSQVGRKLQGLATVAYTAYVWNLVYPKDPAQGRLYGWKRPELYAEFRRFWGLNNWPLSSILRFGEINITGAQRGLGRIGADFWPVIKNKKGERQGYIWDKYPQSLWHNCNMMSHMLVPGPTGPVASTRYEVLREGVQECEARIAIERVLTDEGLKAKLGAELAGRVQQLLDDRVWEELKAFSNLELSGHDYATNNYRAGTGGGVAGNAWYLGSGWQDRTQELYTMAGEVTRKVAEK